MFCFIHSFQAVFGFESYLLWQMENFFAMFADKQLEFMTFVSSFIVEKTPRSVQ